MSIFTVHTLETAPEGSKASLQGSVKGNGFLPNLHAVMAESPELLEAYKAIHGLFAKTSFNNTERTVVWQTINVYNKCHYCVPAHTVIASMQKVDPAVTEALRNETPLPNAKLEALRMFTLQIVEQRGEVTDAQVTTFLDAGYTKRNVLEVLLGLSQKVLSNYTNHLAHTPLDPPFADFAWSKAK